MEKVFLDQKMFLKKQPYFGFIFNTLNKFKNN